MQRILKSYSCVLLISDKRVDLLERDDSVMADRGFDIEEELIIIGLNIPPFLKGKNQFEEGELVFIPGELLLSASMWKELWKKLKKILIFDRILPASNTFGETGIGWSSLIADCSTSCVL